MASDSTTQLCLACYKDRLASVCDNADEYRLFDIRDGNIYPAGLLSLPSKDPMDRTSAILACGVSFLLCGAICAQSLLLLQSGGVSVIPWLTGTVDQVLAAFQDDSLSALVMPGSRDQFNQLNRCRRSSDTGEVRRRRRVRGGKRLFTPPNSAI